MMHGTVIILIFLGLVFMGSAFAIILSMGGQTSRNRQRDWEDRGKR